ncbi:MAG TPA: ATP-binding protein [Fibrobacteria bacterium]|nr:ATP-binding protein [Fibrobacteria bacterium]
MTKRQTSARLDKIRIKRFKAIRDSGIVKLGPLTIFVGNNGSGKSSIIEALQSLRTLVLSGIDEAVSPWKGIQHVRNKFASKRASRIEWELGGKFTWGQSFRGGWALDADENSAWIAEEDVRIEKYTHIVRSADGGVVMAGSDENGVLKQAQKEDQGRFFPFGKIPTNRSAMGYIPPFHELLLSWQFLSLDAWTMGQPRRKSIASEGVRLSLEPNGANLAEILLQIRDLDPMAFDGILEALQFVLPYAQDIQPYVTSELERLVLVNMTENGEKIPSWLLSTGTLRVLAILACLRHPNPPPLLVIEEIENGLDPRTIGFVVSEIRSAVESGRTQVILTTHSGYLLDQVLLEHIVVVERDPKTGEPRFHRPSDQDELKGWAKEFSPGQLYVSGRLERKYGA